MTRPKERIVERDSLVIAFLNTWEASWQERCKYTTSQLKAIRSSLFATVMDRYVKTGEIGFKQQELKQAIKVATRVEASSRARTSEDSINPACIDFVKSFIADWEDATKFSAKELNLIFTKIYAAVLKRYEATLKSGSPFLRIEKKDLKLATESALKIRQQREKEARLDERDRKIRAARARYGSGSEIHLVIDQ